MTEQHARLTADLAETTNRIKLAMGPSSDFMIHELTLSASGRRATVFYVDGMIDKQAMYDHLIAALHDKCALQDELTLQTVKESILNVSEVALVDTLSETLEHVLSGSVLLVLEGLDGGIAVSLPGWKERTITESKTQSVIKGPQDSFTETLRTNTTMVRRRVKDTRLRVIALQIGGKTRTDVALVYMTGIADELLARQTLDQLAAIKIDRVLEGEYVEELLNAKRQPTIFPTLYNTDRPDSVAAGVMDGKIAVFIDGTPFVLLLPALFADFIQSAEDYYQASFYSSLIRMLRYGSLFICMMAPAIYIALTTYHQDMFPTVLLLSLSAQREGVPFPAFIEALIMEITFEILREAGIRMPRAIGQAVSIVGTLVIGQAAVEAGIVSAVMVIVVAITAISSFVIPAYSMSIAIRLLRFGFMALAAMFGAYGLTMGFIGLVIHLCGLHSFGVPYMRPVSPFFKREQGDAILRLPYRSKSQTDRGGPG